MRKKTIEEIKEFVESQDYNLLSTKYVSGSKLKFRCPKKHEFKTSWTDFRRGTIKCPICGGRGFKKTIEEVKEFVENQGCKLLSTSMSVVQNWNLNVRMDINMRRLGVIFNKDKGVQSVLETRRKQLKKLENMLKNKVINFYLKNT